MSTAQTSIQVLRFTALTSGRLWKRVPVKQALGSNTLYRLGVLIPLFCVFFFSSRRRHTRYWRDWSSDVCSSDLRPEERALNSLQLLSFLKTTAHLTGQAHYENEYRKVAAELKYTNWITRVNEFRRELNYSDEELAMLPRSEERRVGKECRSRESP